MAGRSGTSRRDNGTAWPFLLGALTFACGGKSISIDENSESNDRGGSSSERGGSPSGAQGGTNFGATGGNSVGGDAGVAGIVVTGGVGMGGIGTGGIGTGGIGTGGTAGEGGEDCGFGAFTQIVGTVRDPAGRVPLYNVFVYVPTQPLHPLRSGTSCDGCVELEPGIFSAALTDTSGHFVIQAPPGTNVPLVIQSGKWRRQIRVPTVTPCVDNVIDDPEQTRLPYSRSQGDLPRFAVVTGADDSLECLLRRIGIADWEFTPRNEGGAVNLYVGCDGGSGTGADHFGDFPDGEPFPPASELFGDPALLATYDFVLLGCEGSACAEQKLPYVANLEGYANGGGRLFLDHLQRFWIENGSEALRGTMVFDGTRDAVQRTLPASVDVTFPKGFALADWLVTVGGSETRAELLVRDAGASLLSVVPGQRWLYAPSPSGGESVLLASLYAPVSAPIDQYCGRITFSDFHAWNPDGERSESTVGFPNGCRSGPVSAQEAALEFMLFDTATCLSHGAPPRPPP